MMKYCYETANLALDRDGTLYLKIIDGDGEDNTRLLGRVEDASHNVPEGMEEEYAEILDEWTHAPAREALHAEWDTVYRNLV